MNFPIDGAAGVCRAPSPGTLPSPTAIARLRLSEKEVGYSDIIKNPPPFDPNTGGPDAADSSPGSGAAAFLPSLIVPPKTPSSPLVFPEIFSAEEVDSRIPAQEVTQGGPRRPLSDRELADEAAACLRGHFPRIHRQLAAVWGSSAGECYLDELIVDRRGDRNGFPPSVMHALLILQRVHFRQFGTFKKVDPWDIGLRR